MPTTRLLILCLASIDHWTLETKLYKLFLRRDEKTLVCSELFLNESALDMRILNIFVSNRIIYTDKSKHHMKSYRDTFNSSELIISLENKYKFTTETEV
jgi:hypothetical protein